MKTKIPSSQVSLFPSDSGILRFTSWPAFLSLIWLIWTACVPANATSSEPTTIVIFTSQPLPENEWTALFAALRGNLANSVTQTRSIDADPVLLRGDAVTPGLEVQSSISVYLHGDCDLASHPLRLVPAGPLGWVRRNAGQIEPFIHVDCRRIVQVLAPQASTMSRDQQTGAMAEAMARVVVHEWIHVATQNPAHASYGISKSEFGVKDLIPSYVHSVGRLRGGK